MKIQKIKKLSLSLLLAASLLTCTASAASPEVPDGTESAAVPAPGRETVSEREIAAEDAVLREESGEEEDSQEIEETGGEAAWEEPGAEEADSRDLSAAGEEADPEKSAEEEEDAPDEEADPEADPETPEEGDEAPYDELLSEVVLVTLEETPGETEEMKTESVEELSEVQLSALEDYIQEQGYDVTAEAMLAAAPETKVRTITFNMNGFISLEAEGYGTGYDAMFYVDAKDCNGNGNAYCINPAKQAPGVDQRGTRVSYTTTVTEYHDPMLLKIMYYGFGGKGDISGNYASGAPARHILTHMAAVRRAAELGIPGSGDYTYKANSKGIAAADALYRGIRAKEDIKGTVTVLTPMEGYQTIMLISDFSVEKEPEKTELSVKKTVSGTGGNKNREFHFSLTLYAEKEGLVPDVLSCTRKTGTQDSSALSIRAEARESRLKAVYLFSLSHGQELIFHELPVGLKYEVKETDGEELGYTVQADNAQGVLSKTGSKVSFKNSREQIVPTGEKTGIFKAAGQTLTAVLMLLGYGSLNRRGRRQNRYEKQ